MKKKDESKRIENEIEIQPISTTLESNYMPYAMSVIVSRALPEIDGFKPSHRKLLYTMYQMNLMKGDRTKSANVVGQTMRLNPHGDSAIYETLVRLTKGNNALLHPFIDSKGNFGKVTARDMTYAAPRYTEVKLDAICEELFRGIDEDMVEFVDNYDATMKEPKLLPSTFPNILVNPNKGIAVGMSCSFPSFNLEEICNFTIARLKAEYVNPMEYITGADFSTGGYIIKDDEALSKILHTGVGSFKIRAKYRVDKKNNILEIYEIPYTTTVEAVIDKITQLIKAGKIKEISDLRDETDLSGLKLAIDLKRGQDADTLMNKLYKWTTLEDSFACNFNLLVDLKPEVLGVNDIIGHWIRFRIKCIRNSLLFNLDKLKAELHLLNGLALVILDIDRAIEIIRNTKKDSEVLANLMSAFEIDEIQAQYIANIRLKNINQEYLLEKIKEQQSIKEQIEKMQELYNSEALIKKEIAKQLKDIIKKFGKARQSELITVEQHEEMIVLPIEDYPVKFFLTKDGYFKKISALSYRMASEQKLKENDSIISQCDGQNAAELLFFTDKQNVYKVKAHEIEDCKASELGHFLNNLLELEAGESVLFFHATVDFSGKLVFGYDNGKVSKVPVSSYMTKTNRKKLIKAMSDKGRCVNMLFILEEEDILAIRRDADKKKVLLLHSSLISENTTKSSQGMQVVRLKKSSYMSNIFLASEIDLMDGEKYRVSSIPMAGVDIDVLDHFNYPNL